MRLFALVFICVAASGCPRLWGHGAADAVIARLTLELAKQPDDASLHLRRAQAYLDHGDTVACVTDIEHADRLEGSTALSGLLRGRALRQMKQAAAASAALDLAVRAHPDHVALRLEAAQAAEACARPEEALAHQRVARMHMKVVEPDHLLTEVRLLCALHREVDALELIDTETVSPALVQCAVAIEISLQRYDAALARIDALIDSGRTSLDWTARRASLLAQAGRLAESLESWRALRQALHALPPEVRSVPAMVMLLKQSREAISALEAITLTKTL